MKKALYILLFISSIQLFAQESITSLSLQEAIDYALENNRSVKNAERDIDAAKQQKWLTTSTGLPQVNATIGYNNWLKQQVSLLPGEIAGGAPGTFVPVTFGTKQTMNATATLSQKLFDGSYLVGLQSAKVYLEISENAKIKNDYQVKVNTINAYGNVLLAEESLKIVDKNIESVSKTLHDTTKMFESGFAEQESVEQLQITLLTLESTKKNALRLKNLAYKMLNLTIGLDVDNNTKTTDTLETLAQANLSLEILNSEENIENNINYKIAQNDKRSKELLLKLEKSKALPTLNAFINGAYAGNSNTFSFLNNNQQWFGSSLFGVNMNIPIFSSFGRKAATQQAKINLEKSEENLLEAEQQLKLAIANAKSQYQFAIEDYNNKKQNLALAERIEKKNQVKFFEGVGSSFELNQAQQQLYTSQNNMLQAMLEIITKKAALENALNKPLQ